MYSLRWKLRVLVLVAFPLVGIFGCGETARRERRSVSVAAAADLRFAFEELSADFRKTHPDIDLAVSYGSSGNFFSQIQNGAPYDLFLSADVEYTRRLAEAGLALAGSEFVYGIGRIAVWVPNGSPIEVGRLGMDALKHPSATRVAIANPKHAPYGRAAEAALKSYGIYEAVKPKLVLGDNAAQTLQFVQSGNAQAGIVALALALSPSARVAGRYWEVRRELYPRLEQGGIILRWAKDKEAAGALRGFLTGPGARPIFVKYGFLLPGE